MIDPIFHSIDKESKSTNTLTGIASGKLAVSTGGPIRNGDKFSLPNGYSGGVSNVSHGRFIVDTLNSASSLHFSIKYTTNNPLQSASFTPSGGGDLIFTHPPTGSPEYTVTVTNGSVSDNPNLMLVNNPARFIAEFTINSVE